MNATTLSTDFPKSTIVQESNYLSKQVYQDNNISCPLLRFGVRTCEKEAQQNGGVEMKISDWLIVILL